jgi:hypothetical protein
MSNRQSGILGRIRGIARGAPAPGPAASPPSSARTEPLSDEVAELRTRVAHLEQLVQGLQDSVHRGSERGDKRLSEIERRLEPAAIAAALSKDARDRGL